MVTQSGFVATDALVKHFDVTPQTIRRDLNELSNFGLLERFHGGAGLSKSSANTPYLDRQQTGVRAKQQIAKAAAALIPDGASLFLNIGTTTEAVAEALLDHRDLHVITNNLNVAQTLARNETFKIYLPGGRVRNHDGGLLGEKATSFIEQFRTDYSIIGIGGISEAGDLLDFDIQEVSSAQAILRNSQKVILVADQNKFGRRAMNRMAHLSDLDILVTSTEPLPPYIEHLNDADVKIIVTHSAP